MSRLKINESAVDLAPYAALWCGAWPAAKMPACSAALVGVPAALEKSRGSAGEAAKPPPQAPRAPSTPVDWVLAHAMYCFFDACFREEEAGEPAAAALGDARPFLPLTCAVPVAASKPSRPTVGLPAEVPRVGPALSWPAALRGDELETMPVIFEAVLPSTGAASARVRVGDGARRCEARPAAPASGVGGPSAVPAP